jgi:hypothetical protein
MAKVYSPVFLHLDVACEYSTDGGTIWTALAADTYKEFTDADLQADNGRVKVRGTDALLTINPTKMKMSQSNYDAFHIKQANSITSLANSFQYCTIKEIKIENINACTNFNYAFSGAIIKSFHGFTTTANAVFFAFLYQSNVKYIGDITAVNATTISYMFSGIIDNSYIGNLNFGTRKDRDSSYLFDGSEIKSLPYISDCGFGSTTNSSSSGSYRTVYPRYGLYQHIALANSVVDSSSVSFFSNPLTSKLKFSGLSLSLSGSSSAFFGFPYGSSGLSGRMFSVIRKVYSGVITSQTTNLLTLSGLYPVSFTSNISIENKLVVYEDPYWIPEILEVDAYSDSSPSLHNKDSWYSRNMYTGYVSSGQMVEQDYVGGVEDNRPYSNYKVVSSSNVWVSRNGNYAVQTGVDVKIYNKSDVLLSTIVSVTPTCAELSNDGLHFYSVTGALYDTAGASGQTITQTVVKYLISDGSTVSTKTIVSTDAHIVGLYNAGTEYNFAFVFTEFSGATATLSRADAYKNFDDVAVLKTTPMTHVVDYIFHSHGEDCEFNAIDKATTNLCCMFIR